MGLDSSLLQLLLRILPSTSLTSTCSTTSSSALLPISALLLLLLEDWGLIVGGSNHAELVSSLLVPTFLIPGVCFIGRSHEFNDPIRVF